MSDQPPGPRPWDPEPVGDADDLDVLRARRSRRMQPLVRLLAAVVAMAMLLPAGMWLADELGFRRASDAVVETLEGALEGTDAADTVLLVRTVGCRPGSSGSGSAFVVDTADGPALLTNRHVVDEARTVGVRSLDGEREVEVAGVRVSDVADVAVLEVADPDDLPPPLSLRGFLPEPGTPVRLIGFPAATPLTTTGTVAAAEESRLLLDLQVDPGASGSPVVDDDGRVLGQVYAVTEDGLGLATPAALLPEATRHTRPASGC